jgi:TolA-binding protein
MKYALAGLLFGALAVLPAAPALAQIDSREAIALNDQIAELRHEVQALREQVARGGGSSSLGGYRSGPSGNAASGSDLAAQLLQRVSELEEEVRALRGRIDEADNARTRLGEDLSKQIADLNFKVDGTTGGAGNPPATGAGPAVPTAPAPAAAPPTPARRTPELAMQQGNAALARRDYVTAESAAREVLAGPRTPRSADASFLLAQALAGKKDWARAAVAYDDTYNRAKNGAHAQDSLVGLAVALTNLNEKKAACETLETLRAQFPNPRQDLRESIGATRQRAGCR